MSLRTWCVKITSQLLSLLPITHEKIKFCKYFVQHNETIQKERKFCLYFKIEAKLLSFIESTELIFGNICSHPKEAVMTTNF